MLNNRFVWLIPLGFLFAGCGTIPPKTGPVPSVPALPKPSLDKTFGDIGLSESGCLLIQYKEILLAVNPARAGDIPNPELVDYLMLNQSEPSSKTVIADPRFRKNTKIILPSGIAASEALRKEGFGNVKELLPGSRVYLKKNDAFLFASVVAGQGFFLEFDNGRNIFISGPQYEEAVAREFVYSLRDDGKEIHLALIFSETDASAGALAALLQPKNVFYLPTSKGVWRAKVDTEAIHQALAAELFSGGFSVPKPGEHIPF